MKIKFLKDSPDGSYKAKDTANINDWRANYWIKTGVAEKASAEKKERKKATKSEDKNGAPKTESKSKK